MNKREFINISTTTALAGVAGIYAYKHFQQNNFPINLHYPGMENGHRIRDNKSFPSELSGEYDLTIIGSGISALVLCWKLLSSGYKGKICMISGDEPFGNSSNININGNQYPTGAHYLPLQNEESNHTRELLHFFNIIKENPYSEYPTYNDDYLVYSPMERFLHNQSWHDGLYLKNKEIENFLELISQYKNKRGSDNKKLFSIPSQLSSKDSQYLEQISFKDFLIQHNYSDPELINHLNYCCKDDYGQTIEHISAWAGIHYFAGRTGKSKNINHETILTWKNGNSFLAQTIFNYIKDKITFIPGVCTQIKTDKHHYINYYSNQKQLAVKSNKIAFCAPLMMANYLFHKEIIPKSLIPEHSVWLVSNFLFHTLPKEIFSGTSLAYDNIVHNSQNLGFIYSYNQSLDIARDNKVLTSYLCIPSSSPKSVRKELLKKSKTELFDLVSQDILSAYGKQIYPLIKSVDITIRGHAMPFPGVNFISNKQSVLNILSPLEKEAIYFAHSDLSRISIFEEAAWWGYQAAKKIMT